VVDVAAVVALDGAVHDPIRFESEHLAAPEQQTLLDHLTRVTLHGADYVPQLLHDDFAFQNLLGGEQADAVNLTLRSYELVSPLF